MKRIRILSVEDWVGLYIDGKCVYQDHRIDPEYMARLLLPKADIKEVWLESGEQLDKITASGGLPDNWPEELEEQT